MVNYWRLVNKVLGDGDILLIVLDSRFPELTRNKEIEQKIKIKEKKLIYVLNKCDLVSDETMKKISKNYSPCVFVSSKKKFGGTLLFKEIMKQSKGNPCTVGVLGFPNTGKSSVINLLKGKKSASVSSFSGHTKGIQFVKAKGKIELIDTPGVLDFEEKDIYREIIIGSRNPQHVKEPDYFAAKLVQDFPELFKKFYNIEFKEDSYEFLEEAALKRNILKKGGVPDLQRFGRTILQDWQKGKVHEFFLEE